MALEFPYPQLGTLVSKRRTERGETQKELAGKIGISRASLANIESGRQRLLVHQLFGLAAALEVQIVELLPRLNKNNIQNDLPIPADVDPKHLSDIKKVFS